MALRTWHHRLATLVSDLPVVRRRCVVVLWRLRQPSDLAEIACSFTEPSPGIFHVVLTYKGRPEIRRLIHGIEMLVAWSEGVKARLQPDGWREVDGLEGFHRIRGRIGHERKTREIRSVTLVGRDPGREDDDR